MNLEEMQQANATATPWPEIERRARELDSAEAADALAREIIRERPYIGLSEALDIVASAAGAAVA